MGNDISSFRFGEAAVLNNQPGGLIDFQNDQNFPNFGGAASSIVNQAECDHPQVGGHQYIQF